MRPHPLHRGHTSFTKATPSIPRPQILYKSQNSYTIEAHWTKFLDHSALVRSSPRFAGQNSIVLSPQFFTNKQTNKTLPMSPQNSCSGTWKGLHNLEFSKSKWLLTAWTVKKEILILFEMSYTIFTQVLALIYWSIKYIDQFESSLLYIKMTQFQCLR